MRPLARGAGLLVRELPDETLVYDAERHQAHCLNRSAGLVFRLCDGTRTPEEIARTLQTAAGEQERVSLVRLALAELGQAGLLTDDAAPATPAREEGTVEASRRDLLRRLGTAALLPAIASVLAPTPAQAATFCVFGGPPVDDCGPQPDGTRCWCLNPTTECQTHTCKASHCDPPCF